MGRVPDASELAAPGTAVARTNRRPAVLPMKDMSGARTSQEVWVFHPMHRSPKQCGASLCPPRIDPARSASVVVDQLARRIAALVCFHFLFDLG
jgi:hypothetical protein